jgi:hypothetical protein
MKSKRYFPAVIRIPLLEQTTPAAVRQSGLLLLLLMGGIAPVVLLFGELRGALPTFGIIGVAGLTYAAYMASSGRIVAGLIGALPVLLTFNISLPVSPSVRGQQVRFLLSCFASIPLVLLHYVINSNNRINKNTRSVCYGLLVFAILAILAGFINFTKGNPPTGVIYGINLLNISLVTFATAAALVRVKAEPIVDLLFYSATAHLGWALLQSLNGGSFRIPYFGDYPGGRIISGDVELATVLLPTGPFHAGTFAGGFTGNSRLLMGLLIVLFPLAYYRLQRDNGLNLLPKIVLSGSGFTVVLAHTDTGLAVVLFNLVFLTYIYSRVYIKDVAAEHLLRLFPILLITTAIGIWFILVSGWFSNSQPRVVQYVTAWQIWIENPIFGVGGFNSSILHDVNIHNILFSYLSELGIFTTGMYLFVFVAVFVKLVHFYFQYEVQERDLCGASICVLLSFHLYLSLTTVFNAWHIISVFWMVIIIGIHEQSTVDNLGQLSLDDQSLSD